jgi:DNA repair exonuclease SbcCD ATPase subunit
MKLHKLRVESFAGIREAEVEFGPGLNILYGPNDLGKSTLAEAIRLVLLLPHGAKHGELYQPWNGGRDPVVELTFETEEQRIWRVRKEFGKGGSSLLLASRNGLDFDDVGRGRGVDAKLREILGWGIPEPGGTGTGKGLPSSFLATALLSTQAEVADVLRGSLADDSIPTGKERIAAALQAAAEDPQFAAILREVQARRDEAFTDKGQKKTAKGSVFKAAADRLKEARVEKERLEKIVEDSAGVEHRLRDLAAGREQQEHEAAAAEEGLATALRLAKQAADRAAAEETARLAREAVLRIRKMDRDVATAEERVGKLAEERGQAERTLADAQSAQARAGEALRAADEAARSAGSDPEMADTVARQNLELRQAAAEQTAQEARQRLEAATAAQARVDAASRAEEEHRKQEATAREARERSAEAAEAEQAANRELRRCDLLERALAARAAEERVTRAQADVDREAALRQDSARLTDERAAAASRRADLVVPTQSGLAAMRKLANDLASARGALDVGLVLTVTPYKLIDLQVQADGMTSEPSVLAQPLEIEAHTEVEIRLGEVATVHVRGGRREAQERVRLLEERWKGEALPHLTAAEAEDLEALEARMAEARELDARLQSLDVDLESLGRQIAQLAGAIEALREAAARAAACREALGEVSPESLTAEIDSLAGLGQDPAAALRTRRHKASEAAETARKIAGEAATAQALADERSRTLKATLEAAITERDAALTPFPAGVEAAKAAAEASLCSALAEQKAVADELAALQGTIDARRRRLEEATRAAAVEAEKAQAATAAAQEALTKAIATHASEVGGLAELKKQRAAEDLAAAERTLAEAVDRHSALPIPERAVSPEEVAEAESALERAKRDLATTLREIHIAQGALQQVGGAVAREQLRDATEAYEQAEFHDREIEADYEAWKLLLEEMKEADAAQASHLGQALAPVLAERFQALTEQRYPGVHLNPHLGTEGVVVAGALRSPELISVGTREQLSTLYRLCLGEYLQTAVVLDDQLVQSDDHRMDWFRNLLAEKARAFQIVVFTCRPGDYLAPSAMVGGDGAVYRDGEEGFVRAVDLARVVGRG